MRDNAILTALTGTKWADWTHMAIAGDASARRYFRLQTSNEPAVILMDDPALGTDATQRFADIAFALLSKSLSPPRILYHDPANGLMVIEDLGEIDFASHLRSRPEDEGVLYDAATSVLSELHSQKFDLPLTTITSEVAAEMIGLAAQHYAPTPIGERDLYDAMLRAYSENVDTTPHLALRDFHAENLIWRPEKFGHDKVGLLDFQDACFAPAGYDLMSLLRDARREVDPAISNQMVAKFCEKIGANHDKMSAHLACVAAQRNLRILGIFARLAQQDGKTKYLTLLPRVWDHLILDLSHERLSDLRRVVLSILPPPDANTLNRLSKI